jgi:glycosyltransferase involved in cell wall biosynthesis
MSTKTITVTAHDRPELLSRTLDTLSKNNTDGWEIFVSIEPTEQTDSMITIVKDRFPDANILLPEKKRGVCENPYDVLRHVFENIKSDINIYLEEDIDISPDVCDIADFYLDQGCPAMCVCLCNHNINSETIIDSEKLLTETEKFSALGVILSRHSWHDNFKNNWRGAKRPRGWDHSIQRYAIRNKKTILMPLFSRSTHTGEYGTHCNPIIQQKLGYNDIKVYDKPQIEGDYRIVVSDVPDEIELECNNSYPDGIPYVSIVMSTFNKASFLDKTLSSIRNQITSIPYEIIVVDDGSGDDPLRVCKKYGCKYIWLDGGKYRNPAVPRNVGCMAARGQVLIMQSDDVMHKSADFLYCL